MHNHLVEPGVEGRKVTSQSVWLVLPQLVHVDDDLVVTIGTSSLTII
jgi:hypothetical protein